VRRRAAPCRHVSLVEPFQQEWGLGPFAGQRFAGSPMSGVSDCGPGCPRAPPTKTAPQQEKRCPAQSALPLRCPFDQATRVSRSAWPARRVSAWVWGNWVAGASARWWSGTMPWMAWSLKILAWLTKPVLGQDQVVNRPADRSGFFCWGWRTRTGAIKLLSPLGGCCGKGEPVFLERHEPRAVRCPSARCPFAAGWLGR